MRTFGLILIAIVSIAAIGNAAFAISAANRGAWFFAAICAALAVVNVCVAVSIRRDLRELREQEKQEKADRIACAAARLEADARRHAQGRHIQ